MLKKFKNSLDAAKRTPLGLCPISAKPSFDRTLPTKKSPVRVHNMSDDGKIRFQYLVLACLVVRCYPVCKEARALCTRYSQNIHGCDADIMQDNLVF